MGLVCGWLAVAISLCQCRPSFRWLARHQLSVVAWMTSSSLQATSTRAESFLLSFYRTAMFGRARHNGRLRSFAECISIFLPYICSFVSMLRPVLASLWCDPALFFGFATTRFLFLFATIHCLSELRPADRLVLTQIRLFALGAIFCRSSVLR